MAALSKWLLSLLLVLLLAASSSALLENVLKWKDGTGQNLNLRLPVHQVVLQKSTGVLYATSSKATIIRINSTTMEVISIHTMPSPDNLRFYKVAVGLEFDEARNRLYAAYLQTTSTTLTMYIFNTSSNTLITSAILANLDGSSPISTKAATLSYYAPLRYLFIVAGDLSTYIFRFDMTNDNFDTRRWGRRLTNTITSASGVKYFEQTDTVVYWHGAANTEAMTQYVTVIENFNSTILATSTPTGIPSTGKKSMYNGAPYVANTELGPLGGAFDDPVPNTYLVGGQLFIPLSVSYAYIAFTSFATPTEGSAIIQEVLPVPSDLDIFPKTMILFPDEIYFKTIMVHENVTAEGNSVAFIGTGKGDVKKYVLTNPTNAPATMGPQYNAEYTIDPLRPALTFQLVDYTNKFLYYASNDDVGGLWKVPFFTCSTKTTCASCVEFADPYCGWCPLTGTCTDKASCFTNSLPKGWLQGNSSSSVCPSLTFVAPTDPVSVGQQINVVITTSNIPVDDSLPPVIIKGNFLCVFTRQKVPIPVTVVASRSFNQYTCSLPLFPAPLFNLLNETVAVSLQYNQSTPVTLGSFGNSITLFDCNYYTSCGTCRVSSYDGCGWCVATGSCVYKAGGCVTSSLPFGYLNNSISCPSMGSATPKRFPVAQTTEITLSLNNVPFLSSLYGNYTCTFYRRDYLDTFQATGIIATAIGVNITCPSPSYEIGSLRFASYEAVEVSANLVNNGLSTLSLAATTNTNLTAFDCATKVTCETCIPQVYPCGWDAQNNICRANPTSPFTLTTSVGTCPKITDFSPTNVVSSVATPLTITGQYLPTISSRKRDALSYTCVFSNGLTRAATFVSSTQLTCSAPPVIIEGANVQNLTLSIRYGTVTIPSVSGFPPMTTVDCGAFSDSCLNCIAQSSVYGGICGWCDNLVSPILSGCSAQSQCNTTGGIRTFSNTQCSAPTITGFSPSFGPAAGGSKVILTGTNLGLSGDDLNYIVVGDFLCASYGWISTGAIYCEMPSFPPGPQNITARFIPNAIDATSPAPFIYTPNPSITSIAPTWGVISGGTALTISGTNLNSGSDFAVKIGDLDCPILVQNSTQIVCRTPEASAPSVLNVTLSYLTHYVTSAIPFRYRGNPEIVYIDPLESSAGAGLVVTFNGTDLDLADLPTLTFNGQLAEVLSISSSTLVARLPTMSASAIGDNGVYFPMTFNFSNFVYKAPFQFKIYPNPNITDFLPKFSLLSGNQEIAIIGTNLARGTTPNITVSGIPCTVTYATNEVVKCKTGAATSSGSGSIVLNSGSVSFETREPFSYGASQGLASWVIPVIIAVCVAVLLAIVIGIVVWRKQLVHGRKKAAKLFAELDKANETNMNVLFEVMEAYTEYNTRGKFVNPLFNDKPIPLTSFDVFALKTLFPDDDTLTPPNLINFSSQSKALQDLKSFKQLLMKEEFAITFFKTMEQQPDFKLADRKYSAALFIIGLRTEIGHATNLLFSLLKDYITQKVKNGEQKTILRATSTVTEKLLTAWLAFTLHDFVSEKLSKPLFALFMAIKSQIEKGAVDSLTGSSQYTINASTILRQKVIYERVKVNASYHDRPAVDLEVNSCDSISQTTAAILFASGESPKLLNQVALFDGEGRQLKDIDGTNEKDGEWIKINTLAHYNVKEGTELKLMKKSGQDSQALPSTNVYHLEKKAEHDPEQKIAPSEVFFTRMMTMREFIHTQVHDLFEAAFNTKEAPPLPIKILFDFLDRTATELGIEDQETVHIWKNNSLALRFWVNLITNPNQLFDVTKTAPIHNSFSTIGQVLMDSCSISESRLGPGAPASKLLYKTEVDEYKVLVNKYYQHVRAAPRVDRPHIPIPEATGERLDENSALFELRNYGKKHQTAVAEALGKEPKTAEIKDQFLNATQA